MGVPALLLLLLLLQRERESATSAALEECRGYTLGIGAALKCIGDFLELENSCVFGVVVLESGLGLWKVDSAERRSVSARCATLQLQLCLNVELLCIISVVFGRCEAHQTP